MADILKLNVGGVMFTTSRSTLTRYPDSMLASMFSDRLPTAKDEDGNYWIDGNGQLFSYVLDFLRRGELTLPSDFKEHAMLEKEADYYQLPDLIEAVKKHERDEKDVKIEFLVLEFDSTSHSGYTVNDYVRLKIWGSYEVLKVLKHTLEGLSNLIGSLSPKSGVANLDVSDIQLRRYLPQAPIMREILMLGFRMYTMQEYRQHDPTKHHVWFKREVKANQPLPTVKPVKKSEASGEASEQVWTS